MRGDLLWPGAYDPFAGPYTATLLGGAPPARQRRTVLYATRNHDAYHGKRLVVNESAVVAAVSAAAAAADLEFVLFRFQNTEASARAFSAARRRRAPRRRTNIVFCAPGTAVVEIVPAQTVRLFYAGSRTPGASATTRSRRANFLTTATSSSTPRRSLTSCARRRAGMWLLLLSPAAGAPGPVFQYTDPRHERESAY